MAQLLRALTSHVEVADQIPTGYTQVFKSGRDNVTAKRSTRSANVNGFTNYTIEPWFVSQYMWHA